MRIPILGIMIDERFLEHRRRSTSLGGIAGGLVAMSLFAWRCYFDHVVAWDLLAVGVTIAVVKLVVLTWYLLTD
ncbi:MAG: hypothetical protein HY049_14770 [Acidobacteria bacterium]|nr:hypothetical protein [Acidobacteriota bacterium]